MRGITGCRETSLISNICGKEITLRHNHTFGLQVSVTNWYIQRDSSVEGIEFEFYDGPVEGFSITFDIYCMFFARLIPTHKMSSVSIRMK